MEFQNNKLITHEHHQPLSHNTSQTKSHLLMVNLSGADTMKSTNLSHTHQNSTNQEDNYGSTEKHTPLRVPANKFISNNKFKMFRSATLKSKMANSVSVDRYEM